MKRVLLVGAGHAQLAVLAALARERLPAAEVLMVTPSAGVVYSGMVPALVAGRCETADCTIDIAPLAQAAGVHLRLGQAVALDAAAREVTLADGQRIGYDIASINTGATQDRDRIPGARERALFLRPIDNFVALWRRTRALADERPLAFVVIGAGAAGVELALAIRLGLRRRSDVTLACDGPLLATYPEPVQRRARRALERAGVAVLPGRCTAIEQRHAMLGTMRVACNVPIVAFGSDPPDWLAGSGLALDARGLVRIGATLQSASHPEVFAAGDIAVRDDIAHPRSGVYAVRAGAALAANLRALAGGGALVRHRPKPTSLNLLDLGDGRALASWGDEAASGWLMGWWKRRIDRAFVARYRLP